MIRRWILGFALLLVVGTALTLLLLSSHHRGALERYRTELRAKGSLKTFAEIAPPPLTNGPNGAPALTNLFVRLPGVPDYPQSQPAGLPSGVRRALWRDLQRPVEGQTNAWSAVLDCLRTNATALAELRAACAMPAFDFAPRYEDGAHMSLSHLAGAKRLIQMLTADALVQLHDGHPEVALADVEAGLNFTARWNREPTLITQLVRIALASILSSATWDLLDHRGWTEADLASLQAAWEGLDLPAAADTTLSMEAAWMEDVLRDYERPDATVRQLMGGSRPTSDSFAELVRFCLEDPQAGFKEVMDRYPRWWAFKLWRRHQLALTCLQQIETARGASREALASGAWLAPAQSASNRIELLEQELPPLPDWLGGGSAYARMLHKYAAAETQRAVVITAIALERFRLRHQTYPAQLAELTPAFLAAVSRDPMDGQPLRYRRTEDGRFLLYSVGEDGMDEGGDPTPRANSRTWYLGKDAVWPQPAPEPPAP